MKHNSILTIASLLSSGRNQLQIAQMSLKLLDSLENLLRAGHRDDCCNCISAVMFFESCREVAARPTLGGGGRALLENHRFVSVEQNAVFDMPSNGSGEHDFFEVPALLD